MSRNWSSLSSSYRTRLERNGVTREDYESGASLASARGHSKTPEHPQSGRDREQYREYYERRIRLEAHLNELKERHYGQAHSWDADAAAAHTAKASMSQLEVFEDYDDLSDYYEDQYDAMDTDDAPIYYH